jgi:hypothetical protein
MKKKSKIEGKSPKLQNPYDSSARKTERASVAILMHWMRNIIEEKGLDLGFPDVDTIGSDRLSPDLVIYESRRSERVLCVIEAKHPYFNVYNEEALKKPAQVKANRRKASFFCTTNFKTFIWYDTAKVNANEPDEKQIIDIITLSGIEDVTQIENSRYSLSIKRNLEAFLKKLYAVSTGKEVIPKLPIDKRLIDRLHETIRILAKYYTEIVYDRYHKDKVFAKALKKWYKEQNAVFTSIDEDVAKVARQTAYSVIIKIMFYDLLQVKRAEKLDPLEIPKSLTKGSLLRNNLQGYFKNALEIDYETIFTTDFMDDVAYSENINVVKEIKDLISILQRYNFGKLGYDIIGRIFERLIPEDERHNMGQFFTRSDVVDLILGFCLNHEDDKLLDPSCGTGTFLKRAYQRKKLMNESKIHADILETLWGNDIAKFPAILAVINLAINDLTVKENYPNILEEDFFKLNIINEGFEPANWRKRRAKTLGKEEREIKYPRQFDAVVGNPPYTKQEEIPETGVDKYKTIKNALNYNDKPLAVISKRAGIHAYFFVHGYKFLRENGYFGFIVSNSWMDVDYGKGLQEFFLKHYKIIAIIESKVERWFEDADINTCIIILQKCSKAIERENNLVRFVYLKKPLTDLIPPAKDDIETELKRRDAIVAIKNTILAHNSFYQNDDMRIFPISQKALWGEAFNEDEGVFTGAKWGKYLRAPEIFFKIIEKGKDKLVPLKKVARVRRGFTTGANEFFYLTEEEIKKRKIEKEFWMHKDATGNWVPNKVIISPREGKVVALKPEDLKKCVLLIDKDETRLKGKKVVSYIKIGEKRGFQKRPTCSSRKLWYNLGSREPWPILFPMIHHDRQPVFLNEDLIQVDHNLFEIKPKRKNDIPYLLLFLLSTVSILIKEIMGRVSLGEGALKTEGIDVEKLHVPRVFTRDEKVQLRKINKIIKNFPIRSIFEDLGSDNTEYVSLEKVKPDRRELDKIVMGDILGLTDEEQLEIYRAVVDLVKSRIDRAKSVKKNNLDEGLDYEGLGESVVNDLNEKG